MKTTFLAWLLGLGTVIADPTAAWLATLQNPHAAIEAKARACQRLGEAGTQAAIPHLAPMLRDPALNTYARAALERIPGDAGRRLLYDALDWTDGNARLGVIQSLGALQIVEAIPKLTQSLDALPHSDGEAHGPLLATTLRTLGQMATEEAMRAVLTALRTEDPKRKSVAATACFLGAAHPRHRDHPDRQRSFYEAVRDHGLASDRVAAIGHLLRLDPTPSAFLTQLASEDEAIRQIALLTLRAHPSDALANALHEAFREAPVSQKLLLASALRDCSNANTVPFLADALPGTGDPLRQALFQTLSHLGGGQAASALLPFLEVASARQGLARMPGALVDSVLVQALRAPDNDQDATWLIQVLTDRGSADALPAFIRQAREGSPEVQSLALRSMRPWVGLNEVPLLVSLSHELRNAPSGEDALATLARACRQSDPPSAAGALILKELQTAVNPEGRRPWARLLVALGHEPALEEIARDLASETDAVVQSTLHLLGAWPNDAPIARLLELEANPEALRAMLRLIATSEDAERRAGWLQRIAPQIASEAEKKAFIGLLGGTVHPTSLTLLEPYLTDPEVREEALSARDSLEALKQE